jgi:hypothetical protein
MRHIMQSCYMVYIKSIFNIYSLFWHIFYLFIFLSHVLYKLRSFEFIYIDSTKSKDSHHNISEVVYNCFVVFSKYNS